MAGTEVETHGFTHPSAESASRKAFVGQAVHLDSKQLSSAKQSVLAEHFSSQAKVLLRDRMYPDWQTHLFCFAAQKENGAGQVKVVQGSGREGVIGAVDSGTGIAVDSTIALTGAGVGSGSRQFVPRMTLG